jgi:Flp pilus assembly protein TadB
MNALFLTLLFVIYSALFVILLYIFSFWLSSTNLEGFTAVEIALIRSNLLAKTLPGLFVDLHRTRIKLLGNRLSNSEMAYMSATMNEFNSNPSLFISIQILEAFAVSMAVFVIASVTAGPIIAMAVSAILFVVYVYVKRKMLEDEFMKRKSELIRDLPMAVDLIGMVLEAGGTVSNGFDSVVNEQRGKTISEEFRIIRGLNNAGMTRSDSFRQFKNKYNDPEIDEFVFSVIKGEELGTPLAKIMLEQSKILREKTSQKFEKIAEEANHNIAFPSMLIMLASMICIVGPILLPLIYFSAGK